MRNNLCAFLLAIFCLASNVFGDENFTPDQSSLPVPPPGNAIVLFDGQGKNDFVSKSGEAINWPVEDGALISTSNGKNSNHIVSRTHFRDADIHAEFMLPEKGNGNSGLYIHGNYELQIFNSFGKQKPSQSDEGAIYGFHPPLVNACRKPGEWQVYDIRYSAPRRDEAEKLVADGTITAWLNGQKVQDRAPIGEPRSSFHPYRYGTTPYLQKIWAQQKKSSVGPLFLQDHHAPVRYRNVWIVPLDDKAKAWEG